jgi:hypothetical protein
VLATYRAHWPRIGALIAMLVGAVTAVAGRRLTKPQILSAANLMALMAHQYEEYVEPGYFPGQFNRGLFKSDSPRNYPLNAQTAMVINTCLACPFYVAPVVFPKNRRSDWHPSCWAGARSCCTGSSFHGRPGKVCPGNSHRAALTSAHWYGLPEGRRPGGTDRPVHTMSEPY